MNKKIISIVIAVAIALSAVCVIGVNATEENDYTADALYSLNLFKGTDKGYELEAKLNRAQGVTFIVRMYGKEAEALENVDTYETPFTDLGNWMKPYIGYAYNATPRIANGITRWDAEKGVNVIDEFDPDGDLTDNMFLTYTLRVLGYVDVGENAQFNWKNPYELANTIGLIDEAVADEDFIREDAVNVIWNALEAKFAGEEVTLAEKLIEQGVFTADDYEAAKLIQINGTETDTEDTTTGESEDTSAEPEDTSAEPEDTSAEPEDTSAEPEDTSAEPEDTSAEPEDTSAEPDVDDLEDDNGNATSWG